ncbi:uncharacterized protein [Littorina saxatilis]|uniref:uncharacterized protein n=1 Tax=Littorina saxatilis TaxID=31220 RepID=UPI0038B533E2
MKRTVVVLVSFGVLHFLPPSCAEAQLPRKRQNEGGIVQHARKGQNEHKAVSASSTKDRFENDAASQHTQKDEKVPGYTPDPWRQDVTGKRTTFSPLEQDQEEMDAVALSLQNILIKKEPVPHLGKTNGYGNGTSLPPFEKEHSGMAANKATKLNPRKGRSNESRTSAQPPREMEAKTMLADSKATPQKMEAETMLAESKATPHTMEAETTLADSKATPHKMEAETMLADSKATPQKMETETILADSSKATPHKMEAETMLADSKATLHKMEAETMLAGSKATPHKMEAETMLADSMAIPHKMEAETMLAESKATPHKMEAETMLAESKVTPHKMEAETMLAENKATPQKMEAETMLAESKATPHKMEAETMLADSKATPHKMEAETMSADSKATPHKMEAETTLADNKATPHTMEAETMLADNKATPHKMEAETMLADSKATPHTMEAETMLADNKATPHKMEAETMLADSKVTPHKRAAYSLAVHRSKRTSDPNCRCTSCDKDAEYSKDGVLLNVLYNKATTISSTYEKKLGCWLTDGINTPKIGRTCFHSADNDLTPYFTIDMAGVYTIYTVEFTRRDTGGGFNSRRMWALEGSVDGDVCFSYETYETAWALRYFQARVSFTAHCGHAVSGRYLRFRKRDEPNYDSYYHIILCEVTAWVCKPNTFGKTSCQACPSAEECQYVCNNLHGCGTLVPWNVAIEKTASQSSIYFGVASMAIDGSTSDKDHKLCVSMNPDADLDRGSWWQVDMAATYKVFRLHVHSRVDCCAEFLDSFDVFVENYAMKSNSSPTKKCASHRDKIVKNGGVVLLTCDPSQLNEGRYVILLATPEHWLQFCEVRVMGHNVIVYQAGDSCARRNEIKRCHLDHVCTNNICKIKLGSVCTESNHMHCINGTICDGGTCKLDLDGDCTGNAHLCRFEAACDTVHSKCKWNIQQPCITTDSCVSGTECDALNTCKRPVGGNCDSTLDCQSGSQCELATGSTKKCVCSSSGSGSCDPNKGFSGGECATGEICLASHLTCSENMCTCDAGYTVFAANFTCKVAVNFHCGTSADCNTGMECVSNVCKFQTGQRCLPGENQCKPAHACGFDNVCRLEVEADCSNHPLLCKSGAMCEAGLCKLKAGVICTVARGTECGAGTTCSEIKQDNITSKTCRLSPGQPCLGTNVTNCEEDSLCDKDVCKLRLDSDCVGANAGHCKSGTTCELSKCKYEVGQACIDSSQCQSTAVCDSISHTCRESQL